MPTEQPLSATEFRRRFRWLVFHTWNIPPIFGMCAILLIGVLTPAQVVGILTTPLEPAYIVGWLLFSMWFLPRRMRPLEDWLAGRSGARLEAAVEAVRKFPAVFWLTFLTYLVVAPISVVAAAQLHTDFVATPLALFRIELVALIVSIIVGLPIFFLVFDLFGRALGAVPLPRPIFTIRTKVFLIGALVPLLIDTMLVQYFWTRTGHFAWDTFAIWLSLELLAIGGSLIFARSFGQGLQPLQSLIGAEAASPPQGPAAVTARSTDELGVLTGGYRKLLDRLQLHGEILEINNQLLRRTGEGLDAASTLAVIVELCQQALRSDQTFLILHDPSSDELVGVAQTGDGYRAEGHFRLKRDESSLAVWCFNHGQTGVVEDASGDARVSARMRERFGVRASLATPLWLEGAVQGVLMVVDRGSRRYEPREVALIEGLAREAALALHTQRLREARAKAEEALFKTRAHSEALVAASPVGVFEADANGVWTFVNARLCEIVGREPEQVLAAGWMRALHPDDRAAVVADWDAATRAGREFLREYRLVRPDGRTSWVLGQAVGLRDQEGRLIGHVGTVTDITARREVQQRLVRINAELEERVAERTADLEAARDLAERANLAKSEFLSRMSHELRTPLNAILGFAQLLRMDDESAATSRRGKQAQHIEKAGWHLLELINDVLDLSRIEAGTLSVAKDDVELHRLCTDSVRLVLPLARAAGIGIVEPTAGAAPLVALADRTRLNQVLMNLLSNAVKYNRPQGSVRLELRAIDADWVEVEVADTGPGFAPAQLRDLYQPFNRLGADKRGIEGTGIGLVITRRLVEAMGGTLGLATQEGVGSRFTVRLPRARPASGRNAVVPASGVDAAPGSAERRSLLYVEDNASNVELLRSALALRPHIEVMVAADGPAGLESAEAGLPDVIVLDITLPGMDGYEVCRRLRASRRTADTPILALSANAMETDLERGRAAGFDAYITKPLDISKFLAELDRVLA